MTFAQKSDRITLSEFEILLTLNKTKERALNTFCLGAKVKKMKKTNQKKVHFVTLAAMIASLYVVLTLVSAVFGLSSGAIQIRISESLCVLAFFTPAAIPGVTVGCLVSNLIISTNILDIVFGTLATFIGVYGGYLIRKKEWLITLPTILANTIIIPLVIVYGFGMTDIALPIVAIGVCVGEILSAGIIGMGLLTILKRRNFKL